MTEQKHSCVPLENKQTILKTSNMHLALLRVRICMNCLIRCAIKNMDCETEYFIFRLTTKEYFNSPLKPIVHDGELPLHIALDGTELCQNLFIQSKLRGQMPTVQHIYKVCVLLPTSNA